MGDPLVVHLLEAIEDLPHVAFDLLHRHRLFVFFSVAKLVLETAVTEFHDCVLNELVLGAHRVEKVNHLDNVRTALQQAEDLVLTRDNVASFLCSFEGNSLFFVLVNRFKYVACIFD